MVLADIFGFGITVSTHSRLKAAGCLFVYAVIHIHSFNTQPPEGGWPTGSKPYWRFPCFNTQPPEGGWGECIGSDWEEDDVSTHSRLKAAGPAL